MLTGKKVEVNLKFGIKTSFQYLRILILPNLLFYIRKNNQFYVLLVFHF